MNNLSTKQYVSAVEGPTFRTTENLLTIEINNRVVASVKNNPASLVFIQQEILARLDTYLAEQNADNG